MEVFVCIKEPNVELNNPTIKFIMEQFTTGVDGGNVKVLLPFSAKDTIRYWAELFEIDPHQIRVISHDGTQFEPMCQVIASAMSQTQAYIMVYFKPTSIVEVES